MGALLDLALGGDRRITPPEASTPALSVTCALSGGGETGSSAGGHGGSVSKLDSEREGRVAQARCRLREVPSRRCDFVAGEERHGLVPVTVVIRTSRGLVTGELTVPKSRWDPLLFLQFLRDQDERPSG
jgi:hypothetical protein